MKVNETGSDDHAGGVNSVRIRREVRKAIRSGTCPNNASIPEQNVSYGVKILPRVYDPPAADENRPLGTGCHDATLISSRFSALRDILESA